MPEKKGKKTNKKKVLEGSELDLWNNVTKDVKPLRGKFLNKGTPVELAASSIKVVSPVIDAPIKVGLRPPPIPAPISDSSKQMSMQQKKRLMRGDLPIDGRLDLHGMTKETAYKRLISFILLQYKKKHRCLLVITGKGIKDNETGRGQGVLRKEFPFWLEAPLIAPIILTFTPAAPAHGGTGAFYVYLRRNSS